MVTLHTVLDVIEWLRNFDSFDRVAVLEDCTTIVVLHGPDIILDTLELGHIPQEEN